jgi:uncharacterized protein YndB with AHSA1/START domain
MLKWIASGCLVIIVVIGIVMYAGYRKMKSIAAEGPSVSVGIHATPERIFASMSHTDSLASWFAPGATLRTTKKGALAIGDTIYMLSRRDTTGATAWIVDTIVPNRVIGMRWISVANNMTMTTRRDSISTSGDSTLVTSTIGSFMSDSLAAARARANGVSAGVLEMGSTMGVAGARMQAEAELKRLKTHIEGRPVSPP